MELFSTILGTTVGCLLGNEAGKRIRLRDEKEKLQVGKTIVVSLFGLALAIGGGGLFVMEGNLPAGAGLIGLGITLVGSPLANSQLNQIVPSH